MTEETKIIYYKDTDSDKVPYMIKLSIAPDKATLRDFKQALNVNVKNFKFFFQQIVEDFGVVKEEICDDDMKLPFVNGRAVSWLHQVEESNPDSDTRSQNSINIQEFNSKSSGNNENRLGNQFNSNLSVSSQGSSMSNNENVDRNGGSNNNNRNSKHLNQGSNGQIYDTLNNRKSNKNRHNAILKDLNADDTSTDTESLINGFDDIRIHHQRPTSMVTNTMNSNALMIGGNGNGGSGSMRRSNKNNYGSLTSNVNNHIKPGNHKRSLDSQNIMQNVRSSQNRHSTNGNFYSNFHQPQKQHHQLSNHHYVTNNKHHKMNEFQDSFSENSDDDTTNFDFDDNNDMSQANTATTAPSIISSNLDTTTFFDTENDDDDGQFSSITENTNSTMASSRHYGINRNRRKLRHKLPTHHLKPNNSLHSSMSSLTDSTMSLNIITVTLKMDSVNFLGISIVGQSNKGGEGGIYVGSIMSGGAVAQDGRIEPGDMILQVNEVSFENMSNDDAVRVLREAVMKPGPVKLVVAKCWDPNPQGYFTVSKQEPIRPIDPSAWVAHTQAHTGTHPVGGLNTNMMNQQNMMKNQNYRLSHSVSTFGSNSSLSTSLADSTISTAYGNNGNYYHQNMIGGGLGCTTTTTQGDSTRFGNEHLNLTIKTDMETLVRAMAAPDSGLDVRDRNWLKITIPNAFIGSDVVDWLFNHVEGFPDRRDARKYACDMLRFGFIRHAVNKVRFSEQCYYIFGDFNQSTINSQLMAMNGGGMGMGGGNLFTLNEESEVDFDSVSELDRDTLYAPMNYNNNGNSNYHNVQNYQNSNMNKLYANLNGIGGPPPPPSYMSSSSSNATSNSTSTTSNNTTTQTIATCTTTGIMSSNYMNTNNNTNSSSGMGGSGSSSNGSAITANSTTQSNFSALVSHQIINNGIVNSERHTNNACQLYYPTPSHPLDGFTEHTISTLSSTSHLHTQQNMNSLNTDTDDTIPLQNIKDSQQNTINPIIATPISIHSNHRFNLHTRIETKSMKSSDNSSSGNGSDVELLSSKKSKNKSSHYQHQSNYYEITQSNSLNKSDKQSRRQQQQPRSLDQVPKDLRNSKQSFSAAMDNPCEFFVDVM